MDLQIQPDLLQRRYGGRHAGPRPGGKAIDAGRHRPAAARLYRWRLGLSNGAARYDGLEEKVAGFPAIAVPTITMKGDANGAPHPDPAIHARRLTGGIGHNLPQEAPAAFAQAAIDVDRF